MGRNSMTEENCRFETLPQGYCKLADGRGGKVMEELDISVLCSSPLMRNMSNAELLESLRQAGDCDAWECRMNLFVGTLCILMCFLLFGLDVAFNALDVGRGTASWEEVGCILEAASNVFKQHTLEEISEEFYVQVEREVLVAVNDALEKLEEAKKKKTERRKS